MPTIKSLFLTGGSRFIFNSCTQKTAMFDKTDYDNYQIVYYQYGFQRGSSCEPVFVFKIFGRCIRFPTSGSRTRSSVSSAEVRYDVLSRVGHALAHIGRIADGDINVKTPDGFSTTIRVYTFRVRFRNNADDIVY
jgi:hypothetical protein